MFLIKPIVFGSHSLPIVLDVFGQKRWVSNFTSILFGRQESIATSRSISETVLSDNEISDHRVLSTIFIQNLLISLKNF